MKDERRPSLVIGTAGHIDHGKSALVRALTGIDPDRLKEEKARGITIDLGFAQAEIGGVHVAFVDVPGHERFVKNMLAGVGGIDAVLLVVAADESVMPQTREHFAICRLLRIPAGVIALTKADLADAEMRQLAALEARELVSGSVLEAAPIVPVSAATGQGLDDLRAALAAIATAGVGRVRRGSGHPVRLPIDRVFSVKGFGTVVTGTLIAGDVRQDDELIAEPGERRVKVRGLQVHGHAVPSVGPGHRVAVNLGGVDVADLARGQTLLTPGTLEPTKRLDTVVELLADARPLRHGTRVRFHHGTAERLGRVSLLEELRPGGRGYARLRLEAPVVLSRGDRFILRAYSPPATIGGGEVLDPQPPRAGLRTEAGRQRLERIDVSAPLDQVVAALVNEAAAAGLVRQPLAARLGQSETTLREAASRLEAQGTIRVLGDVLVSAEVLDRLAGDLLADLEAHHRAEPLSDGLPREEARSRRFSRAPDTVFEEVVGRLAAQGRITGSGRLALASHRVVLSERDQHARTAIERAYREAGLKPLPAADLAAALGVARDVVERLTLLLIRQRILTRVDDLVFHSEALARLKDEVAALKEGGPARVDVGAFKEKFGISRKFAIPLLEYLDRERVTRRAGDARVVI